MSDAVSRRDFIKVATAAIGGVIGLALGIPAIGYLIDPALRSSGKEGWVPVSKLEDIPIGTPFPFSFTSVQVNGWERTSTNHGGFILRRSEDPADMLILNSRCTHLGCTVNWKQDADAYLCPCHDAKFSREGAVLGGPPPRPLDRYTDFRVNDTGVLELLFKAG
ncbi:MAG TPA: ubiquinol-cytochrome c reductase iron-sulfur subunit [Anaerolineales bacterium]